MAPADEQERFLDLLEEVDDDEDELGDLHAFSAKASKARQDELGDQHSFSARTSMARQESSHGPLHWNSRLSAELQNVVDSFCMEDLYTLDFSVTIADPTQPDCPLVACSTGFTELTGYTVQEIVGRNCRFLLNGVPNNHIDDCVRMKCRSFCLSAGKGEDYCGSSEQLPPGMEKPWVELPQGEMICVQTNARKSGELFRNMFYLKQIELDDNSFILGLQAELSEEIDTPASASELAKCCQAAFGRLESNMSALEQVLAQQFWYSAPMRRQV
jgi:hypothetical protein